MSSSTLDLIISLALLAVALLFVAGRAALRSRRPPEDELVSDFRKRLESLHGTGPFAEHGEAGHEHRDGEAQR